MSELLNAQVTLGIVGVGALYVVSSISANVWLPKDASRQDRWTFIWLVFDVLIHFLYEGTFVYYSTFGRTVNSSTGLIADIWKEYAVVDSRWGTADPTTVSIEIITVVGAGLLAAYILRLMAKEDPMRYFWTIVLSTAELYGGWMTFAPEWLIGSPSLDTSTFLNLWVLLVFMNGIWVAVPLYLLVDAFVNISKSFKISHAVATGKKTT